MPTPYRMRLKSACSGTCNRQSLEISHIETKSFFIYRVRLYTDYLRLYIVIAIPYLLSTLKKLPKVLCLCLSHMDKKCFLITLSNFWEKRIKYS